MPPTPANKTIAVVNSRDRETCPSSLALSSFLGVASSVFSWPDSFSATAYCSNGCEGVNRMTFQGYHSAYSKSYTGFDEHLKSLFSHLISSVIAWCFINKLLYSNQLFQNRIFYFLLAM
jgi:hypothetical protein